ncbi:hypothetical protein TNCV_1429581 [Trichonephila clavipes]|nr:hypothetical protein TNCV_1429581 [Trichonephila clavipes]
MPTHGENKVCSYNSPGLAVETSFHTPRFHGIGRGCGSPVVKVLDNGRHVMSSIPVRVKSRRAGERCPLNLSRLQTSSRWCGVVVRRWGVSSGVVLVP